MGLFDTLLKNPMVRQSDRMTTEWSAKGYLQIGLIVLIIVGIVILVMSALQEPYTFS
jgi:hypothetical protein